MEDNKKKFEVHIEYEDDFDSWLADNDSRLAEERRKEEEQRRAREAADDERRRRIALEQENAAKAALGNVPVRSRPSDDMSGRETAAESAADPAQPVSAQSSAQRPGVNSAPQANSAGDVPISRRPVNARPADGQAPAGGPGDIPISHRDVVKNFVLNIDESAIEHPVVTEPPKKDKAIYFAGRQPTKAQLEARRASEEALEKERTAAKKAKDDKRRKEVRQVNRLRRTLVIIIVLIISGLASFYGISCINDILAFARDDELIVVKVNKGDDCDKIIDTLRDNNLIYHPGVCKAFAKFRKFDQKEYINGVYYLTPNMGVEGMLNEMRGTQTSDETIRLYFPEGWTIQQIAQKLAKNNVCPEEYIYTALKDSEFDFGFTGDVPSKNGRYFKLEGYMFPDTYDFFVSSKQNGMGENPTSVIRKLLSNFETKWTDLYAQRADELGLSMDEVITIASIIQKEAANEKQMKQISSVIHNRLNDRANFPNLGCDSTKNYVTNYLSEAIGKAQASKYAEFYDTNGALSGLPVGPICNPGVAAIEAALNPDQTNYYYFCHNDKGEIYLAETYAEFQRNWAQVLKDNEES